jgi:hypothetical protein
MRQVLYLVYHEVVNRSSNIPTVLELHEEIINDIHLVIIATLQLPSLVLDVNLIHTLSLNRTQHPRVLSHIYSLREVQPRILMTSSRSLDE